MQDFELGRQFEPAKSHFDSKGCLTLLHVAILTPEAACY